MLENREVLATLYWDTNGATPGLGGSGTWNTTAANWTTDANGSSATQAWNNSAGNVAVFAGNGGTVTLGTGITASGLTFNSNSYSVASNTLTLNGSAQVNVASSISAAITSTIAGNAGLSKIGAGTLTVSGTNSYSGGTQISAGIVVMSHASALGTGAVTVSGTTNGHAQLRLSNGITTSASLGLTLSSTDANNRAFLASVGGAANTWGGTITLSGPNNEFNNGGTDNLTLDGAISSSSNSGFSARGSDTTTINGVVSVGTGLVSVNDTAILLVNSTGNTWGNTTVAGSGSTLKLGANNALPTGTTVALNALAAGTITVDLNGHDQQIAGLSDNGIGTRRIGNSSTSANGNLTYTSTAASTFSGVIQNVLGSGNKTVALAVGGGTLTLTGANTYTGTTTISAGTLQVGNGGTTGALGSGAITDNGSLVFNRSNSLTVSNTISGTGSVSNVGTGALTVSGTNSYTGGTTVTAGTFNVQNNQSAANGGWTIGNNVASTAVAVNFQSGSTVAVASGKSITLNQLAATAAYGSLTVAGTVNNSGTLNLNRAFSITLNSGADWTQAGDLSIAPGVNTAYNTALTVNSGADLTYTGTNPINLSPSTGGSAGTATLTVAGTGVFTTAQSIQDTIGSGSGGSANLVLSSGGTLRLSDDVTTLTSSAGSAFNFTLGTGGGVIDTQGYDTEMSRVVSGAGAFTKAGAGELTFSGANTFTGNVTLTGGELNITNSNSLGTGTKNVSSTNNIGQLHLDGSSSPITLASSISFVTSGLAGVIFNDAGDNTINGDFTLTVGAGDTTIYSNAGNLTLNGDLDLIASNRNLNLRGTGDGVINGTISNSANTLSLVKQDSGTWTLNGDNAYTGDTTVKAGVLKVGGSISGTADEDGGKIEGAAEWYQVTISPMAKGESAYDIEDITLYDDFENNAPLTFLIPDNEWLANWRNAIFSRIVGAAESPIHYDELSSSATYFKVNTVAAIKAQTTPSIANNLTLDGRTKVIVFEDFTDGDWDDWYWVIDAALVDSKPHDPVADPPPVCLNIPGSEEDFTASDSRGDKLAGGVEPSTGNISVVSDALSSSGFGTPFGQQNVWTNQDQLATDNTGAGMATSQTPKIIEVDDETVVVTMGTASWWFDLDDGDYVPRFYHQQTLVHDAGSHEFVFTDTAGTEIRLNDFDASLPAFQRGTYKSVTDQAGNLTEVTAYTAEGRIAEVQRTAPLGSGTVTESYLYTYITSGHNKGLQSSVTQRRKIDSGAWSTVRVNEFTYYSATEANGNAGELKLSVVKDGSGATLDTTYYRYYVAGETGGYQHGLKFMFGSESFARLSTAYVDPFTATDAQVDDYADVFMEYDANHRVVTLVNQGQGCSACTGGLGTYTYEYSESGNTEGYNSWARRTIETLPDGNQNIVYSNFAGQTMLRVFKDTTTSDEWITFYKYDDAGRQILMANPSAVTGYNDTYADLLHEVSGNYEYLADESGLVTATTYYATTTATDSTAGGVAGYVEESSLRRGELGDDVPQNTVDYIARTADDTTIYAAASSTVYRNDDGTGAQTSIYEYTWFTDTTQIESVSIPLPVVSSAQNGSDTADVTTRVQDAYGRTIWTKDAAGFLNYTEYDQATGAVVRTIQDVDTGETGDFADLPTDWETPAEGGLHLITLYEVDSIGRQTRMTDANGHITFTTYNDSAHETRTYSGFTWDPLANSGAGGYVQMASPPPTQVVRYDRAHSYTESLTMSATPVVDGTGRPTGAEAISGLQTLARSYTNAAGQLVTRDEYFDFTGMSYSTAANIGTQDVNFYRTEYRYDHRGRMNRVLDAEGAIRRTIYDGLGRVVSIWKGTDDTPDTGWWSPANYGGTDMVQIIAYRYDGDGVGDGNLTQTIALPDDTVTNNRMTDLAYDWRNRLVATKAGVEETENADTNRPLTYSVYDNLNHVIASLLFDGDGVVIADDNSDGVPDQPDAELLRSQVTQEHDDQSRIFRTTQSEVDLSTGEIGEDEIVTEVFFDSRGFVVQSEDALDRITTYEFDGAGRLISTTLPDPDGAGDLESPVYLTSYDNVGYVLTRTDANNNVTTYEYDDADRVVTITQADPDGAGDLESPVTTYAYNASGWRDMVTDPLLRITSYAYDRLGRTLSTTLPDPDGIGVLESPVYSTTYDGLGNVLTRTDANENITSYSYDPTFHRLIELTEADPDGIGDLESPVTTYVYNLLGDLLSTEDAAERVTTHDYNVLGQRTKTTEADPDGPGEQLAPWTVFTYDTQGAVLTSTSRLDETNTSIFDGFHRLFQSLDANNDATTFTYDLAGNRLTLTDAEENTTTWVHDDLNRVIEETNEFDDTRYFDYDANGNIIRKTDRNERVTEWTYDGLNRRTEEVWLDGVTVMNTITTDYNVASQVEDIADDFSDVSYTYDDLGRATGISQAFAGLAPTIAFAQAFDSNGNRTQLAADIGADHDFANDYLFDGLNRNTRISQAAQGTGSGYNFVSDKRIDLAYNAIGQFSSINRFASLDTSSLVATSTYGYDLLARLTGLDHARADTTSINTYAWGLDAANRITSQSSVDGTSDFGYDATGQLTDADHSFQTDEDYDYDANGNRTNAGYSTGENNQLESDGTFTYEYDFEGNRTLRTRISSDPANDYTTEYTWDHRNRLTSVTLKDNSGIETSRVEYTYDVFDHMVGRQAFLSGSPTPGESQHFIYDGMNVVAVLDDASVVEQRFLNGAAADQVFAVEGASAEVMWTFADHLNTVRDFVDSSGEIVNHREFDSFGNMTDESNPTAVDYAFTFTGGYSDPITGLTNRWHRWYDANSGRWISEDPANFAAADSNLARYALNSPTIATDPTGLVPFKFESSEEWYGQTVAVLDAKVKNKSFSTLAKNLQMALTTSVPVGLRTAYTVPAITSAGPFYHTFTDVKTTTHVDYRFVFFVGFVFSGDGDLYLDETGSTVKENGILIINFGNYGDIARNPNVKHGLAKDTLVTPENGCDKITIFADAPGGQVEKGTSFNIHLTQKYEIKDDLGINVYWTTHVGFDMGVDIQGSPTGGP